MLLLCNQVDSQENQEGNASSMSHRDRVKINANSTLISQNNFPIKWVESTLFSSLTRLILLGSEISMGFERIGRHTW